LRGKVEESYSLCNLYRSFDDAGAYANSICAGCEEDEFFMEVFIEFVTKSFQRHIGEAYGKKIGPGNGRRAIPDENKIRNKSINVVRFSNGKEIRTENVAEINSNVIKAEMKAIVIRSIVEQYMLLYRTFHDDGREFKEEELCDVNTFDRIRANLSQNIRSNIMVLEEDGTDNTILKNIKEQVE
jgi:hypothetical protein